MVKRNTPDWQRSAFDKVNNSCVKTKPFNEKIKELEAAYAKEQETSVKIKDIDKSVFYLKEEPVKEEKDDQDCVPLVMLTHRVLESNMMAAIQKIESLATVTGKIVRIRLETLG